MKKIMNPTRTEINKRGLARWAFAIVGLAFLMVGTSAFAAPPANDNFANATVISASPPATVNGNNAEATSESGEPLHSDYFDTTRIGTNSVWWTWTPSTTGSITIDTINSGFDTELAVYTGGSVDSLTPVEKNEDGTGLANGWSKLTFNAVSGTTYHIAVSGFENISGPVALNFSTGGGTVVTGLSLTVNTTGGGSVTVDPTQPAEGYETNTVVNLTAVPTGTNTLISWSGTDNDTSTELTNTVTMTENKTVTAAFTGTGGGGGGGGGTNGIVVLVNGNGRVSPDLNGKNLTIGKRYRLTARPARDWIFAGWDGAPEGSDINNSRLSFVMEPGLTITANFILNPFVPVSGTYNGLFYESNNVTASCAGYFTVKVAKSGRFTARFIRAGKTTATSGRFNSDGTADVTARRGTNVTTAHLQLDGLQLDGNSNLITGTITTPEGCTADIIGDRQVFSAQNESPFQGTFTFIIPREELGEQVQSNDVVTTNFTFVTNNAGTPDETIVTNSEFQTNTVFTTNTMLVPGHSYATLSLDKRGKAKIRGSLADGSKINQTTAISEDGNIPFFEPLYHGDGLIIGWLNVTNDTETNVGGTVHWQRPAGALLFPDGINADIDTLGSPFNRTNSPLLSLTNPVVEIGGNSFDAGFAEPLIIPVQFSNNNTLTDTNGLSLKLLPNGLVRGKFISPVTGKSTPLNGAMLQNIDSAFGYFLKTGSRGYFQLRNQEAPAEEPQAQEPQAP